jgi:hypothetical protein
LQARWVLKYFSYRTRRDRISLVGQAFNATVKGLSSDAEAKKLAAAILLRRFFEKETEQGAAGTPYEREAVAVMLLAAGRCGQWRPADGANSPPSTPGPAVPIDLTLADLSDADLWCVLAGSDGAERGLLHRFGQGHRIRGSSP